MQVRLDDDGSTCSVRMQNLLPAEHAVLRASASAAAAPGAAAASGQLTEAEAMRRLGKACRHSAVQDAVPGRADVRARVAYVQELLAKGCLPPPSRCNAHFSHSSHSSSPRSGPCALKTRRREHADGATANSTWRELRTLPHIPLAIYCPRPAPNPPCQVHGPSHPASAAGQLHGPHAGDAAMLQR